MNYRRTRSRVSKPRRVKVWVFLAASLVLALLLLGIEIGLLGLVVDIRHINSTLYELAFFPSWALNAFPAGYILRLFGLRVSR